MPETKEDPETRRRARRYVEICQDKQCQPNSQLTKLLLSGMFNTRPLTCYVQFAKYNYLGERGSVAFLQLAYEERLLAKATSLDFSGQGLRDSAIPILVEVLQTCPKLVSVNLSNNVISTKSGQLLCDWVQKYPEISNLDLSETRVDIGLRRKINRVLAERGGTRPASGRDGPPEPPGTSAPDRFLRRAMAALSEPVSLADPPPTATGGLHSRLLMMVTYFRVNKGRLQEFRQEASALSIVARADSRCLFYDWMLNGQVVGCRQGYVDADALIDRLKNDDWGPLLLRSVMTSITLHGPKDNLDRVRAHLSTTLLPCAPEFFDTL